MEVYGWGDVRRTVLASPQPAAGQGVTVGVPESEYQTLLAVTFRLVTSASVATRVPIVSITDGSGVALVNCPAGKSTVASLTADYTFAVGLGEWDIASTTNAAGGLPTLPLAAGDSIVVSVSAIDAADQLSRVRVTLLQRVVRVDGA
jgi:hypothetical protein